MSEIRLDSGILLIRKTALSIRTWIGSWSDTVPKSPLAVMDEVVLYNRALSTTEIAAHAAAVPEPATTIFAVLTVGISILFRHRRRVK